MFSSPVGFPPNPSQLLNLACSHRPLPVVTLITLVRRHAEATRAYVSRGSWWGSFADPTAQEAVFGLLLPHFRRFYELDEGLTTPIKLEACTVLTAESFRVVEPLQVLLYVIQQMFVLQPADAAARRDTDTEMTTLGLGLGEPSQGSSNNSAVQVSTLSALALTISDVGVVVAQEPVHSDPD